ncbi:MAG: thrombospondin type 3 repeat-containing protein [Myxococcota bacterium]|nr:thrombospondin type 3 repeat-containing protein [Myxococcota bacterium]
MRRLFVVLALAGCDKVLGLKEHPLPDTPANGHDEDNDGLGDAEDNCPTIKGSQEDSDQDGVGDLCDPNPGVANRIAAFYAFDTTPIEWVPRSGSWIFTNDQLVHKGTSGFSKIVARNGLLLTPPYVIEAKFRFDTAPVGSEFSISAALDDNAAGSFCTIINGALMTEILAYSPGQQGVTRVMPLDFTATFTARMLVEPARMTCIMNSDTQGDTAATSANPDPIRTGPMGLEGRNADTTTDYVIIYAR